MSNVLTANRPAIILSGHRELEQEYRAARYLHHKLLDFEDSHQKHLDEVGEKCAPHIGQVARIVVKLKRRIKRAEHSTGWSPPVHSAWLESLSARLEQLRKARNNDVRWARALKWADLPGPDSKPRGKVRRRAGEGWTGYLMRCADRRISGKDLRSRRDQYRLDLYQTNVSAKATERSRIYWGTWNGLLKQVDQARAAVLKARKAGLPSEWKHPRWDHSSTLYADAGGFHVVDQGGGTITTKRGVEVGNPWWVLELRLSDGWVRFKAKLGNWHNLSACRMVTMKLTRRRVAHAWTYAVSIAVEGVVKDSEPAASDGMVGIDWGHREHGHPRQAEGIRVYTWVGSDGRQGEILLPKECREALDSVRSLQSRVDLVWDARRATFQIAQRNRHKYRRKLMQSGVRTLEESQWLEWEQRYERRLNHLRKRIANLRQETYIQSVRELRSHYQAIVFEKETGRQHRKLDQADEKRHRKRQNRELSARYLFVSMCERFGADVIEVSARNTTRQCPHCHQLHENTSELMVACPTTGVVYDKDYSAATEILARGQAALAIREASG